MRYWYGYTVVELDSTNPGNKCLSDEFLSYDDAKRSKQSLRATDMEFTAIFQATEKKDAKLMLEKEQFSRL